jgi:hypothetical protein
MNRCTAPPPSCNCPVCVNRRLDAEARARHAIEHERRLATALSGWSMWTVVADRGQP